MRRVVIVGAGPAAMFCADRLLDEKGVEVIMLEQGRPMTQRWCPETRSCRCSTCFVIEGEGGAGGFSDGKLPFSLQRGTQGEQVFSAGDQKWLDYIDDHVVTYGGEGVRYDGDEVRRPLGSSGLEISSYPLRHVGTDGIRRFTINMMEYLVSRGLEVRYDEEVVAIAYAGDRRAVGVVLHHGVQFADEVVLAPGIAGLPWIRAVMAERRLNMLPGPAGIGVRVETRAELLAPLFDRFYDWKVDATIDGIHLRSFCCNGEGSVVTQYHERLGVRGVNGHSYLNPERRTESSNFALIAKISPGWDGLTDEEPTPQAYVERAALNINGLTGGHPGVGSLGSFMGILRYGDDIDPADLQRYVTNRMARARTTVGRALPPRVTHAMCQFLNSLFDTVPGVRLDEELYRIWVYGPELKYPAYRAPVNLDTYKVSGVPGLRIIGDATGYVDSLVAASVTGLKAADSMVTDGSH